MHKDETEEQNGPSFGERLPWNGPAAVGYRGGDVCIQGRQGSEAYEVWVYCEMPMGTAQMPCH